MNRKTMLWAALGAVALVGAVSFTAPVSSGAATPKIESHKAPTLFKSLKSSFPDVFPYVAIHVASLKTQNTS